MEPEPHRCSLRPRWAAPALAALILAAHFALLLGSARQKSLTTDEPYHLARGAAAWFTGDFRVSVAHPPLINLITAAPLRLLYPFRVPTEHPAWSDPRVHPADRKNALAYLLLHHNPHHDGIVFHSRLTVMMMSLALGLLIHREARRAFGELAGLGALALYAFSPTVLAHARLVTTDLGATLFIFIFALALRRHLERPGWSSLAWCGLAFGTAQLSKYTAILLIPLLPLVLILVREGPLPRRAIAFLDPRPIRDWMLTGAGSWLIVLLLGALTIWAGYGFEVHSFHRLTPPAELAGLDQPGLLIKQLLARAMAAIPIPPGTYYYGLSMTLLDTSEHGKPLFFMGRVSQHGWWWYYPVMFVIKEPLSLLSMIGLAAWVRGPRLGRRWGVISAVLILGIATFFMFLNQKNIGVRHLLPFYPFLFIWIAKIFQSGDWKRWAAWALVAVYGLNAFASYPDYLVHFNRLAGGPDKGLRYAVVGEDWGQDLYALGAWMKEKKVPVITYLPYGNDDPAAYGVNYEKFECGSRKEGWYAFHVVDLRRPTEPPAECLAPFTNIEPAEILHHTIYLYWIAGTAATEKR